ncbi:MAG: exodeoxyribonuclease V subunit gamma [Elusimicrobiota bacterium]
MLILKTAETFNELEARFIHDVQEIKDSSPFKPVIIVVPSNRLAEYLSKRITKIYGKAWLNVDIVNLYSYIFNLFRKVSGDSDNIIFNPVFHAKVIKSITETRPQLLPFNIKPPISDGVWSGLYSTITDIVDAGLDTSQLLQFYEENRGKFKQSEVDKIFQLSVLYQKYLEKLGVLSYTGVCKQLTAAFEQNHGLCPEHVPVFYGFYEFTGVQYDFISMLKSIMDIYAFIVSSPNIPGLKYVNDYLRKNMAEYSALKNTDTRSEYVKPVMHNVLPHIFSEHYSTKTVKPGIPGNNLKIVTSSGQRDAIWYAAKEIVRLVENEKYKFSDIAIVSRGFQDIAPVIEDILTANSIPYTTCLSDSATRYPLTKYCLQLLTLDTNGYPADTVSEIVTSRFFPAEKFKLSKAAVPDTSTWVRIIVDQRLDRGWQQWDARLNNKISLSSKYSKPNEPTDFVATQLLKQQQQMLTELINVLHQRLTTLPSSSTWENYALIFTAFLDDFVDKTKFNATGRDSDVWNAIISVLNGLKVLDKIGMPTNTSEFLETLLTSIDSCTVDIGDSNIEGIHVLDIMSFRGMLPKAVFLLGLEEHVFPGIIREDPFLKDTSRGIISTHLGGILRAKLTGRDEEKLLFYLTLSSATDKVYLLYQRADDAGKTVLRSSFVYDLLRRINGIPQVLDIPRRWEDKIRLLFTKNAGFRTTQLSFPELLLLSVTRGETGFELYKTLSSCDFERITGNIKVYGAITKKYKQQPDEYDGFLKPEDMKQYYDALKHNGISPSALKTFAACPYQYFLSYLVHLRDLNATPTDFENIESSDIGDVYHLCLEEVYNKTGGLHGKSVDDLVKIVNTAITRIFSKYTSANFGVYHLLWELWKERAETNVLRVVLEDSKSEFCKSMIPEYIEKNIFILLSPEVLGKHSCIPLRGKSDRVDTDSKHSQYRVIDYKTTHGDTDMLKTAVQGGKAMPLALYIKMVEAVIRSEYPNTKPEPVEARWYIMEPRDTQKNTDVTLPPNFWDEYGKDMCTALVLFIDYIHNGNFFVNISDGYGACGYCPYSTICIKQNRASVARVQNSDAYSKFIDIIEKKVNTK